MSHALPPFPRSRVRVAAPLTCLTLLIVLGWTGCRAPASSGANSSRSGRSVSEPSEAFFRDWLLCGPFPLLSEQVKDLDQIRLPGLYTDWLREQGGETSVRPRAGALVSYPGGTCTWKPFLSAQNAVSLDEAVSRHDQVVAYAYREIQSSRTQPCVISLGSNDGARVWFNGEAVFESPGPRGLKLDHNLIPVVLRPGTNTLLVKIEERANRWEFACRLLPVTHPYLADRLQPFEVVQDADGLPSLRARQSPEVTRALVKSAHFEVASVAAPQRLLWSGDWSVEAGSTLAIGVPGDHFAEYLLRQKTQVAGGGRQDLTYSFTAGRRVERVLFAGGRTDYRICLAPDASESEKWAAQELQRLVQEVGGVKLPVEVGQPAPDDRAIVVGWQETVGALFGAEARRPAPQDESFTYRSRGSTVFIWGGSQRGTLYGVMSFLEREMGVRFYTPRVTVMPKRGRFAFVGFGHTEAPGVRVRNDFYFEAFDPIWAAHNRINGAMGHRPQPGGLECYWSVHTFYPLMPPEEFFKDHPEYYSLLNGVRTAEHAQLCLSNPDVLRIITERIRRRMRESPEYLIYDVSQNDWSNPCACRECQAVVDREGSQSGPIIQFVNQVADQVKAEFPDKFIGTLAYSYTRKPPKTLKPRENVVVRFCSIECCFAHDFVSCPENKTFVADMNGWAAISPHIYIWDYVVNFSHYLLPFPNFRALQPNIRFFRDHRAIGIMEQAAYQCRGGEFSELRSYVLAKLLWDPETSQENVINDFLFGYYGRSGQFVRAYFDLLHGRLTPETHIRLGLQADDRLFSDEFVRQAGVLFDQAEAVADSEEIRQRVELARLPVMYLKCKRNPVIARLDGTYARFCAITEREGVTLYAEAGTPHKNAFHSEVENAR